MDQRFIEESYGLSYTEADTTNSRLRLKFIDDSSTGVMVNRQQYS